MDKYWLFRELLDFVADRAEVVNADMNNYAGNIVVTGDDGEQTVKIEVSIKDKEENKND